MIFRPTQKLNAKVHGTALQPLPLDPNPYADWSARVFPIRRTQYILVTNTASLFSTLSYGRGVSDESTLIERALESIRNAMVDEGIELLFHNFVAPATGSVRFGKPLSRAVTGAMNDFADHAEFWIGEKECAPDEARDHLNNLPCSALRCLEGRSYSKPREAIRCLAAG